MVTAAPLGIVDTLSAGFAVVNRRLWILLLPVLLDLLLIYGPAISINPLVDEGVLLLQKSAQAQATGSDSGASTSESTLLQVLEQSQKSAAGFRDTNLAGVLAWQVPSVVAATSATPLPKLRGPVITEVSSGWVLLSYVLALALLSLLWVSFYLAALAHALRNEVAAAASLVRRATSGWLSFSLFFALLLVLLIVTGGALVLVLGVASLFGSGVVALITSVVTALALAASFYLFFVDDAIFLLEVWPRRAVWYSVSVVWRNFWPSLGFVLLVNLVITGTALVWGYLLQNPFGLAGAVLGHAYITTGFAAAGMLFFAQRYALWQREAVPGGPG